VAESFPDDLDGARESFGEYYLSLNAQYQWLEFQQEKLFPALERVEKGECRRLAVFMHPGLGKTTAMTAFSSWYIGKHPSESIMNLSYSSGLARDAGLQVSRIMHSGMYGALFPDASLSKEARGHKQFMTVKGGNYWIAGFKSVVSGRRVNLMILDDLIRNWKEANSETTQAQIINDYKSIIRTRLTKNGSIVLCMTRWGAWDAPKRILELEGIKSGMDGVTEGGEWEVLSLPAEDADGNYLCEELVGAKTYERAKKDKRTWQSLYMQDPSSSEEDHWFKATDLEFYDKDPMPGDFKHLAKYMICDPALGKRLSNDRTSIPVFAAGENGRAILVDWVLDRLDPFERTTAIIRLLRKWMPRTFIYEAYGLLADAFYLEKEIKAAGLPSHCYPIQVGSRGGRHQLAKEDRVRQLVPDVHDHLLWLPRKLERKLVNGDTVDLIEYFIREEFSTYAGEGSTRFDDGIDSFSRLKEPELDFKYINLAPSEEDDYNSQSVYANLPPGASWEGLY